MYKLMIVDDDEVICRGLSLCTDWESMGVIVSDIAFNAIQALEKMRAQPVDICITDICMPVMDGLEFACIVSEEFPGTKIILLSAFSEFKYAQKAVNLGVFQYLTKPFSKSEVLETITSAVVQLDAQKKQLAKLSPVMHEMMLLQVLTAKEADEELVEYVSGVLQISLNEQFYRVMVICIEPFTVTDHSHALYQTLENKQRLDKIRQRLSTCKEKLWYTALPLGGVAVVVKTNNIQERDSIESVAASCVGLLNKHSDCFYSIGVSIAVKGSVQLPQAYLVAKKTASCKLSYSQQNITYEDDINETSDDILKLILPRAKVKSYIKQYRFLELRQNINSLFVQVHNQNCHLFKIQSLALELLLTIMRAVEEDSTYNSLSEDFHDLMRKILIAQDIELIHSELQKFIEKLYYCFEMVQLPSNQSIISTLCSYIQENYKKSTLSVKEVAESVPISNSYLAYLFKKHLSCNFTYYLTKVRMEEAMKILLSTDSKTYEVSEMVGYNSAQYFNISFKKYTGHAPGEYKLLYKNIKE